MSATSTLERWYESQATRPSSPLRIFPGVEVKRSQMLSPRPSSPTAPSTWYAAVAAPQTKPGGKLRVSALVADLRVGVVSVTEPIKILRYPSSDVQEAFVAAQRAPRRKAEDKADERAGRVTIRHIAERAGVSKGAVSYALNGRPGVSEDTRDRILAIARELGWYPNRAARALSAARADACGLVLARPARTLALEPFFMEFLAGVESELSARSIALTIQLVGCVEEEISVYRRWWGE